MQAGANRTSRRKYLPQPSAAAHTARTPGEGRQEDIHMKKTEKNFLRICENDKMLKSVILKSKKARQLLELAAEREKARPTGILRAETPAAVGDKL